MFIFIINILYLDITGKKIGLLLNCNFLMTRASDGFFLLISAQICLNWLNWRNASEHLFFYVLCHLCNAPKLLFQQIAILANNDKQNKRRSQKKKLYFWVVRTTTWPKHNCLFLLTFDREASKTCI